jgi:hypothetical protein
VPFVDKRAKYDELVKRLYGEGRRAYVEVGVFASAGAVKHDSRVLDAKQGLEKAVAEGTISKGAAATALGVVSQNPAAWAEIQAGVKILAAKQAKAAAGSKFQRLKRGVANASKRFRQTLKKAKRSLSRQEKKAKIVRSISAKQPDPRGKKQKKQAAASSRTAKEPSSRNLTVLDVATWNEFGAGNVPQRSFLRAYFDENGPKNSKLALSLMQTCVTGKRTPGQVLNLLGVKFVGEIQRRMAAGIPPPNAPSTIRRKGSSKPLIDTGQLRSSIAYRATWGSEIVGGTKG